MLQPTDRLRRDAIAIYEAAVAGVEPRRALTRALASTPPPTRVRILALGKAALPMAAAAVQHLDRLDIPVAGGLVVTADAGPPPDPRLHRIQGDHPVPGSRSLMAAAALETAVEQASAKEEVWLLISGGTTSLVGAPVQGVSNVEYGLLVRGLGRAGLPIGDLNRIRKRFSRWGAGRLALACRAARIRVFALSDVPGDALADIGSGPCEPDPTSAAQVRDMLAPLVERFDIPATFLRALDRVSRGEAAETPKSDHPAFGRVGSRIVGSNAMALDHAAARAAALGYAVVRVAEPLTGEAAVAGRALISRALASGPAVETVWIQGGETTVTLGPDHGLGGRCQELALAAASELVGVASPMAVLAGGTDGRDGPTDAAGAVVVNDTWKTISDAGIDPAPALARHDAFAALRAAGALLQPGLTDTNVMDIVLVLVGGEGARAGEAG